MLLDTTTNKEAFLRLLEAIRSNQTMAFAGAGVSRPLGYPTWSALIDRLTTETRDRCGEQIVDDQGRNITVTQVTAMKDLLFRAEIFKCNLGARYFEIIQETFSPRVGQSADIRDLVSLPFQHLLTSNYDIALEQAHDELQLRYDSICLYDAPSTEFVNNLGNYGYDRRIVHVHGRFDSPQRIVLTEKEYGAFYHASPVVKNFWQMVPIIRRCVFFGFSFNDTDLTASFNLGNFNLARRGAAEVIHFALVALDQKYEEPAYRALYNMKYGIDPVFFDGIDSNFSGYSALMHMLAREIAPPTKELRVGLEAVAPVEVEETGRGAVPLGTPELLEGPVPEPLQDDVARLEQLTDSNLRKRATGDLE